MAAADIRPDGRSQNEGSWTPTRNQGSWFQSCLGWIHERLGLGLGIEGLGLGIGLRQ